MKRFIRYLYEYQQGKRLRNVGFVKAEQGEEDCTLHIHGKGLHMKGERQLALYLFYEDNGECTGIYQGTVDNVNPAINYRLYYTKEDVIVPEHFRMINGIILESETGRRYAAVWNDSPVDVGHMRVQRPEDVPRTADKDTPPEDMTEGIAAGGRMTEPPEGMMPEGITSEGITSGRRMTEPSEGMMPEEAILGAGMSKPPEEIMSEGTVSGGRMTEPPEGITSEGITSGRRMTGPPEGITSGRRMTEPSEGMMPEGLVSSERMTEPPAEAMPEEIVPEEEYFPEEDSLAEEPYIGETEQTDTVQRMDTLQGVNAARGENPLPLENPSQDDCGEQTSAKGRFQCTKIQRNDLARLPRCEWKWANNSFLLHGYYNYHHLALINDGEKFRLGVPGIYHPQEAKAASTFGFMEFIPYEDMNMDLTDDEKSSQEQFGYWCRPVKRPVKM
ncbi:MAG: hypothetical protein HFG86_13020 [Dorea sp.]|nr:hypothetical protein [Dorea sp.]